MTADQDFPSYAALADALIERATKDQLADVARLLALKIGWYQHRYGDVPQDALLKMARGETLDEETLALVSSGMENLVSALAEVTGLRDDLQDASRPAPHAADAGHLRSPSDPGPARLSGAKAVRPRNRMRETARLGLRRGAGWPASLRLSPH
jgi:hypothetical protein